MRKIRDYRCITAQCGEVSEHYVEDGVEVVECTACLGPANLALSAPSFHLDHTFPGKAIKWAKDHEKGAKKKYE